MGFVEDEEAVGDGAASDVAEGFDFEQTSFLPALVGLKAITVGRFWRRRFFFLAIFLGGGWWGVGGQEDFECVVDGLEPRVHFFFESSGEEAEGIAHGDDGTANGQAGKELAAGEVKAGCDGEEGFASACAAEASDEGDFGVEEGIEEALLAWVERAEFDAAGDLEGSGDLEALKSAFAAVASGENAVGSGLEEDVFVEFKGACSRLWEEDFAAAGEALELVGFELDGAEGIGFEVFGGDFVAEVILAKDADSEGF